MPRQIIDTESSKPAYHRRVLLRWVIIIVLFIVAILAALRVWQATRPRMSAGAVLVPGKVALRLKPGAGSPL